MGEKAIKAKELVVDDLTQKLQKAQSVILYDYIGLKVAEVSALRNQFRKAGIEYKVIKNTMIKRAADKAGITGLDTYLNGPTAVAISYTDPVAPAKILTDFIKQAKKTEIKSGILIGKVITADGVKQLASLPSKEELLAKMLGSLNAPATGFVMVLSGVLKKLVYAINAIKESKEA